MFAIVNFLCCGAHDADQVLNEFLGLRQILVSKVVSGDVIHQSQVKFTHFLASFEK